MLNKCFICGRLTRDVETRDGDIKIAKYSLAVDRKGTKGEEKQTDFLNCVCFGKTAEFAEKYLHKGMKIIVIGRIQTGSYTNKEGQKVNTTDIIVEEHEFAESKKESNGDGFMDVANVDNLPF